MFVYVHINVVRYRQRIDSKVIVKGIASDFMIFFAMVKFLSELCYH